MVETAIEKTLLKHLSIVIDTDILYNYLKAVHFPKGIDEFDALVLKNMLPQFSKIYVTPQVLTEVNGLAKRDFTRGNPHFLEKTKPLLAMLSENYVEKNEILSNSNYCELGPTDTAIIISTQQGDRAAVSNDEEMLGNLSRDKSISMADMRAHYLNYNK